MKICTRCKKEKELTEFGKNKAIKSGYRFQCKQCRNEQLRTGKPNTGRFKKGNKPQSPFVKGQIPWNKDKKGLMPTPWNKGKFWTDKKRSRRFKNWAKLVRDRDEHECKKCGSKEKLHSHHIIPWKDNIEKRFDIENGITLCNSCHAKEEGFQKGHEDIRRKKTW